MSTTATSPGRRRAYREVVQLRRRMMRAVVAAEAVLRSLPSGGGWPDEADVGVAVLGTAWLRLMEASDALQHGWWVPSQ